MERGSRRRCRKFFARGNGPELWRDSRAWTMAGRMEGNARASCNAIAPTKFFTLETNNEHQAYSKSGGGVIHGSDELIQRIGSGFGHEEPYQPASLLDFI